MNENNIRILLEFQKKQTEHELSITEYQVSSLRTMPDKILHKDALTMLSLGLAGETGEVVEIIKKHVYHGHLLDVGELQEELGDVMWYISNLCNLTGISLEEVMKRNIEKLKRRYPEGFNSKASINRK